MKKLLLLIFSIMFFLVIDIDVYAAVNNTNAEIECIYANGIVIGMNYDKVSKQNLVYVKNYPISNSVEIDFETITNISLQNSIYTTTRLQNLTCPPNVYYWIAGEKTSNGNYSYRGVYNFSIYDGMYASGSEITLRLLNPTKSGWWIFSSSVAQGSVIPVRFKVQSNNSIGTTCGTRYAIMQRVSDGQFVVATCTNESCTKGVSCEAYASIGLVAERLYFVDDLTTDTYGHTYKLYNDNEQAISTNKYAQIFRSNSKNYLQIGQTITSIDNSNVNADYVCIKESITSQDSSRGESEYKFSSIRHEITKTSNQKITCSEGELYVKTTETCKITTGEKKETFCDKYSNTAFVLIDIIQIMQILVPAIVIIFTGIEIGRIVLAGNIEEELPKRKKNIFIRLIVMVAFFFLPTIVQLIISLAEGVSILDVSCLFNDEQKVEQNQNLTEQNCVYAEENLDGENSSNNTGTTGKSDLPEKPGNSDVQVTIK